MSRSTIEQIMHRAGVIFVNNSHIVYTSGKHGRDYTSFKTTLRRPLSEDALILCQILALRFVERGVGAVVGPESGGTVLAEEVAAHLSKVYGWNVPAFSAMKVGDGNFAVRQEEAKDFLVGRYTLVVEDTVNSGGSVRKVVEQVRSFHGVVIGVGALCDGGGLTTRDLGAVPMFTALISRYLDARDEAVCKESGPCSRGFPINTEYGHGREYLDRIAREAAGSVGSYG